MWSITVSSSMYDTASVRGGKIHKLKLWLLRLHLQWHTVTVRLTHMHSLSSEFSYNGNNNNTKGNADSTFYTSHHTLLLVCDNAVVIMIIILLWEKGSGVCRGYIDCRKYQVRGKNKTLSQTSFLILESFQKSCCFTKTQNFIMCMGYKSTFIILSFSHIQW